MTPDEWIVALAAAFGTAAPNPDEVDALLDLAGEAARASERTAAPVSAWLAGRAGIDPVEALTLARRLRDELDARGATSAGP